jgi:hypothetical protein
MVSSSFRDDTGYKLGRWATEQRRDYREGRLREDRMARLESLVSAGWTWGKSRNDRAPEP